MKLVWIKGVVLAVLALILVLFGFFVFGLFRLVGQQVVDSNEQNGSNEPWVLAPIGPEEETIAEGAVGDWIYIVVRNADRRRHLLLIEPETGRIVGRIDLSGTVR